MTARSQQLLNLNKSIEVGMNIIKELSFWLLQDNWGDKVRVTFVSLVPNCMCMHLSLFWHIYIQEALNS